RLEFEKQEAAKIENYEEAKEKKEQIHQIREEMARNIDLDALLSAGTRSQHYPRSIGPPPKSMTSMQQDNLRHSIERQDELEHGYERDEQEVDSSNSSRSSGGSAFQPRQWHSSVDERPLPALM
ncbi:unnamed protein product, partial [Hymenolepis diminuta]